MPTSLITVVIPFPAERMSAVDALIESLSSTKEGNIPREEIRHRLDQLQRVHYMSIVAVDGRCPAAASEPGHARDPERSEAAHLVIEVTADGSVHEALEVLAGSMGAELESVLAAASIERGGELLASFLHRHYRPIGSGWSLKRALGQVHLGAPGMTVRRILQEQELAQWLGEEVQGLSASPRWHDEMSPIQRLQAIRELAWSRGDKWAFVPEPAPCLPADPSNPWNDSGYSVGNPQARKAFWDILHTLLWPLYLPLALAWVLLSWSSWQDGWNMTTVIWTLFVAFVLLLSLVLTILALYRRLRHYETRDLADDIVPPAAQVEALMKEENHFAQNHMATVSRLKPSLVRRLALRVAFVVVGTGRFVGAPGFLGKNGVIHVARWMRLPGTSQLMFWSNFDGTWESYVADFIADAPTGVTAIWSNCRGFPKTAHLFRDGAEQRDKLVNWARRQQHPTRFWYSAYPDLTGARIRNNAALRQGLASAMSDADARDWLALFGSSQRPADALDLPEIPTLVFGGLMKRRHARCLLVHWRRGAEQACRWLSVVERDATFGETRPGHLAVAVALASSGLKKLGLPDDAMATFPTAFQQDMWPSWRARALGDEAVNDPRNWTWGPGGAGQRDPCRRGRAGLRLHPGKPGKEVHRVCRGRGRVRASRHRPGPALPGPTGHRLRPAERAFRIRGRCLPARDPRRAAPEGECGRHRCRGPGRDRARLPRQHRRDPADARPGRARRPAPLPARQGNRPVPAAPGVLALRAQLEPARPRRQWHLPRDSPAGAGPRGVPGMVRGGLRRTQAPARRAPGCLRRRSHAALAQAGRRVRPATGPVRGGQAAGRNPPDRLAAHRALAGRQLAGAQSPLAGDAQRPLGQAGQRLPFRGRGSARAGLSVRRPHPPREPARHPIPPRRRGDEDRAGGHQPAPHATHRPQLGRSGRDRPGAMRRA